MRRALFRCRERNPGAVNIDLISLLMAIAQPQAAEKIHKPEAISDHGVMYNCALHDGQVKAW